MKRKLTLAVVLAGCAVAQTKKAAPPASLRLYVFDCGMLNIPDIAPYQLTQAEIATSKMALPCFLVAHPRGTLAWDVGGVPDSSFKPGGEPATLRFAVATKPLKTQLAEIGYAPADITYIAFSHFHWDHIA